MVFPDEEVKCSKVGILSWRCKVVHDKDDTDTGKTFGDVLLFAMDTPIVQKYKQIDDKKVRYFMPENKKGTMSCFDDLTTLQCEIVY